MRFVIQRVSSASVSVEGKVCGQIEQGYMILVGVSKNDTQEIADKMLKKMLALRIFSDEKDKINLSVQDMGGSLLIVSQFTLYADCKRGNRPGFSEAAAPEQAKQLYDYILDKVAQQVGKVQSGIFGAKMEVSLVNDGPFTICLDSYALF